MRYSEKGYALDDQTNPRRFTREQVQRALRIVVRNGDYPEYLQSVWGWVYNEEIVERLHARVLRLNADPANHALEEPIYSWIRIATFGFSRLGHARPAQLMWAQQLIREIAEAIIDGRLIAQMLQDPMGK